MPRALPRLILAALLAWLPAAGASPIQWTLADVLFEDGGTASGSFVYDADTDVFSDILVTTTAGAFAPGAVYTSLVVGGAGDAVLTSGSGNLTGAAALQLVFYTPLTNAGGLVPLVDLFFLQFSSYEGSCVNASCSTLDFARLMVDGGVIGTPAAVVPVPAAAWLLGSALAGLGMLRRRAA